MLHSLVIELGIGAFLICLTVAIHAIVIDRIMTLVEQVGPFFFRKFRRLWKVPMLMLTVLCVFCSLIAAMWTWALVYFWGGALKTFEECLYFSTVSFTTLGYGDIVLGTGWRVLNSIEAANGMLLFGWSTAFIFEVVSKLYAGDKINKTKP